MDKLKHQPVDKWIIEPINKFINNSIASGVVLFLAAIIALVLSNSPFSEQFHNIWEHQVVFAFDKYILSKNLSHWINDGLMSIFFFVVGLELKRELVAGELARPKQALLPILAAIGGMVVPAIIYHAFNHDASTERANGWGIPMATDIAFALGVLYLLGDRVSNGLKVFLTALAIVDDLGAVLVIAFFYTSDISFVSLGFAALFLSIMIIANLMGVRSAIFYGIIGVFGLWTAFLMSGIHATIAAVLAAFTIPATVKIEEDGYIEKINHLINDFKNASRTHFKIVTDEQQKILSEIRLYTDAALTPLQKLIQSLHPLVAFIIMPIFALANAGVAFDESLSSAFTSKVTLGVFLGLLVGKLVG
ncbi:MAG TPA: Na+/H+ antiporter NhaA, partial [Chitinophagales bacterium]|nr:Na+/H+ antiporter NhaA [Chitinophagales bacterium]